MQRQQVVDMTEALLMPGGLYDQAEAAFKKRLAADPPNGNVMWTLSDISRGKGDFQAALAWYRRFLDSHADHAAAVYLCMDGYGRPRFDNARINAQRGHDVGPELERCSCQ